jgi:Domain of unknown function (DUF4395)
MPIDRGIDPRAPRFAAAITTVVLAAVLLTGWGWLLAVQAAIFAVGAFAGLRRSPYSMIYRVLIRPRLGPPDELEPEAPPRFAQGVGLAFAVVGLVGFAVGSAWIAAVPTALALGAAFLNAAFGFCLGCEFYLLVRRFVPTTVSEEIAP